MLICLDWMGWVLWVPALFCAEFGPWRLRITKPSWTFAKRTGESEVVGFGWFLSKGKIEDEETGHVWCNYSQVHRYFFGFVRALSYQRSTFILDLLHPCWSRHAGARAKPRQAATKHFAGMAAVKFWCFHIHEHSWFNLFHEFPMLVTSSPMRSTCIRHVHRRWNIWSDGPIAWADPSRCSRTVLHNTNLHAIGISH